MQIRLRSVEQQGCRSWNTGLQFEADYNIASRRERSRSTPRADAQRLTICCDLKRSRLESRGDKPFDTL